MFNRMSKTFNSKGVWGTNLELFLVDYSYSRPLNH